jgi:3-isopropylmalate/(R)-2-methylmalate dehydratase small subunit
VDGDRGLITIIGDKKRLRIEAIPPFMQELIEDGGLMKHLVKKNHGKENL